MKKTYTNAEYRKYSDRKVPKSPILKNMLKAFFIGGVICTIGQIIYNILLARGIEKETSSNITSILLILIGSALTGMNLYNSIGKFGGAGAVVPITGFANSIVSPAMEFKSEGKVIGIGAKMFVIAGPVIVIGATTSIIVGIIYWIMNVR